MAKPSNNQIITKTNQSHEVSYFFSLEFPAFSELPAPSWYLSAGMLTLDCLLRR